MGSTLRSQDTMESERPSRDCEPEWPPLEAGDRLTRAEFERRYDGMPGLKKAELIGGVVYMGSPVGSRRHGIPHADLMTWLGIYRSATPSVLVLDNASLRIDEDNMPQPDAIVLIEASSGGRARISEDDYVEGVPELVAEVASSSVSIDLHDKLNVYRRAGVPEYLVWRVRDRAIDWFVLREGRYEPKAEDATGLLKSGVFPGLWLDPAALLAGELAKVMERLGQGIGSAEHSAFVERLKAGGA